MDTPKDPTADRPHWDIVDIVARLRESREVTHNIRHRGRIREYPSREALLRVLDGLCAALFPTHFGRRVLTDASIDFFVGHTLNETLSLLREQVRRGMSFDAAHADLSDDDIATDAARVTSQFASRLPEIRGLLVSDLHAAYAGDPAATCTAEILLSYPGMRAIIHHRIAHEMYKLGGRLLARVIAEIAHSQTGVDIHPGATIGGSFFIDHGTGVVIGETAIIGERVRLYQAVTLGAKRFETADDGTLVKGNARHPVVEDDVVIYAGATVLGRITIGKGSTIGGNVWVTQSLPPGSVITQAQVRQG